MAKKLPPDAFAFYVGLGPERGYQAVANHYQVSKQAVTRLAGREGWQKRLEAIDRQAQEKAEQRAAESLDVMNERHLKTLQVIQRKALEALKSMPLATAMEAVRALDMSIGKERLVRGEPSDRTAVAIEDVIRKEYQRWMALDDNGKGDADGDAGDEA
jgi:hypothetical protein